MDLTQVNFHIHPQWELFKSSPKRLIFKSPHINDTLASIEIELEGDAVYGLIKSAANPIGNRVILGKGMPLDLFLMIIVDVLAEDIIEYSHDLSLDNL
jgi:hypothetical protein|uniref:hypothetical protein n=1 Tax=Algoriphagus sp. TaxID=1872435 RepID=UPI004048A815